MYKTFLTTAATSLFAGSIAFSPARRWRMSQKLASTKASGAVLAAHIRATASLRSGRSINVLQSKRQERHQKNDFRELMHSPSPRKSAFAICASHGALPLIDRWRK
jgi:hypothetical protein